MCGGDVDKQGNKESLRFCISVKWKEPSIFQGCLGELKYFYIRRDEVDLGLD